jgi:hypothetical protein
MAAPEYVPVKPMDDVRAYESPPRRPDPWRADRPGDFTGAQPRGRSLGSQGPDQGYALKLAREVFLPQLALGGVAADDALAGGVAVALARASVFGRAPVAHDLRLAFGLWGFLDPSPPADLVEARKAAFAGVAHPHHYAELRALVDTVPESTLRLAHGEVRPADWRTLIRLDGEPWPIEPAPIEPAAAP